MKVYLAGKMDEGFSNWRVGLIGGAYNSEWVTESFVSEKGFPEVKNAILGIDTVTGPFPLFEEDSALRHAISGDVFYDGDASSCSYLEYDIFKACCASIEKSQIVFAWIESLDCYGTIAELAYAKGIGKSVYIGVRHSNGVDSNNSFKSLEALNEAYWFVFKFADKVFYGSSPLQVYGAYLLYEVKALAARLRFERTGSPVYARGKRKKYVYFIFDGSFMKIGISEDPKKRLRSLQTGTPYDLDLVTTIEGDLFLEEAFHKRLSAIKKRGEWYRLSREHLQVLGIV